MLDTPIAIWAALDPDALSPAERRWMEQSDGPLVLSAVAVWEIRLKWHCLSISGVRKGPIDPRAMMAFAAAINWAFLPLTAQHAVAELDHPMQHRDPFDELLLVQAQMEGLRLITRDTKLTGHPIAASERKR